MSYSSNLNPITLVVKENNTAGIYSDHQDKLYISGVYKRNPLSHTITDKILILRRLLVINSLRIINHDAAFWL